MKTIKELINEKAKEIVEAEIKARLKKLGVEVVQCKRCGKDMIWLRSKSGKSLPVTLELINHFADCPNAKEFRK